MPHIIAELQRLEPDFVALSEVTQTNLEELQRALSSLGLHHIVTTCSVPRKNSLLVASRELLTTADERIRSDPERWLAVEVPSIELKVLCIHIPGSTDTDGKNRKGRFWDEVVRYAQLHRDKRVVILGDFNTGLKEDAEGTPFALSDRIRILRLEKYVDSWRSLNQRKREYTWYSTPPRGSTPKGFRLDYIFTSRVLQDDLVNAEHVHTVRLEKVSDHSIVLVDIALG